MYLLGAHEGRGLDEGGGVLLGLGAVSIAGGIRRPRQVMAGWHKPEEEGWEVARLLKRQRCLKGSGPWAGPQHRDRSHSETLLQPAKASHKAEELPEPVKGDESE